MMRISMWLLLALAACGKSGASREPPPDPAPGPATPGKSARVTKLVERLQTHDFESTRATMEEIRELAKEPTFTEAEGAQLLRSTLAPFPKSESGLLDLPAQIITAVGQHPRDSYAAVIEEMFPKWKRPAREAALRVVSAIASPSGTATFVRLLKQHIADATVEPGPIFEALEAKPHHAKEIVPIVMELTQRPAWAYDANLVVLKYCKQGLLQPRLYLGKLDSVLAAYRVERDWLTPKQRPEAPGFAWTEEYGTHRERAAVLLDLMQCVQGSENIDELKAALTMKDARLVYFAATSLLENEVAVSDETIARIAASPEMRGWLFEDLRKRDLAGRFPAKYATQEALAESALTVWLTYPTELGRPPDDIALGKRVTVEEADYYVFKFRLRDAREAARKGWMAGVVGPYPVGAEPTGDSPDATFSNFTPYGSQTPEQLVATIAKQIGDANESLSTKPR